VLTPQDVAAACALGATYPLSLHDHKPAGADIRYTEGRWISNDERSAALFDLVTRIFKAANEHFQYEVDAIREPLLHATYPIGGHFAWHTDTGPGPLATRKLSISVLLSSPNEFEGGDLEFCPGGKLTDALSLGTAIVFPSYMAHRVSPVTAGARAVLVGWIHGKEFR
jgi:PKHD-type hydroxylase